VDFGRAGGLKVLSATGDISGWVDELTLKATTPDGTKLDMKGVSADVLRRQKDGNWAYLIDNPYGAAYLPPLAGELP